MWEIAVYLAVAGDVFYGVFSCRPFSQDMSWMRSGIKLSQFLRVFLPTLISPQGDTNAQVKLCI